MHLAPEIIQFAQAAWPLVAGAFVVVCIGALAWVVLGLLGGSPDYTPKSDHRTPYSTPEEDAFRASEVPWYVKE
jgi:hypothetical protein